jgi:hypothetical protein
MKRFLLLLTFCIGFRVESIQATDGDVVELTKQLIASLTARNKVDNWPRLGPLQTWDLEIDTYTHDLPSSAIADLYACACKKLATLYGKEVKTFTWEDR